MVPTARKSGPAESKLARTCLRAAVISQFGNSSARCSDLGAGRGRESVSADLQCRRYLTLPEDLDQLSRTNRAVGGQVLGGHGAAIWVERGQPVQVDDLVGRLELGIGEALQLGQPAVQRHLSAFERLRNRRPGLAALSAAPGSLALGGLATADPRALGTG